MSETPPTPKRTPKPKRSVAAAHPSPDIRIQLPQYPSAPASLAAAATFYSAAREEILERVRFRDQVVISVIAGIFVFVGTYGAFIFGPAGSLKSLTMNDLTAYCGNLLFVTGLIWVGVAFVTRYAAYQNSKIAELGYFISKVPALHLQEYGILELEAQALELSGPVASISKNFDPKSRHALRESLGHWDRWARKLEEDENIKKLRDEFSQDRILQWLLMCLSLLPMALLLLFVFKFAIVAAESDVRPTESSLILQGVILTAVAAICAAAPWSTWTTNRRGNRFKDFYKGARSDIPMR